MRLLAGPGNAWPRSAGLGAKPIYGKALPVVSPFVRRWAEGLLVPPVVPLVDAIPVAHHIALGVEGERSEHGLVRALVQRLYQGVEPRRARLPGGFGEDLDR